jgi:hypothetical protein
MARKKKVAVRRRRASVKPVRRRSSGRRSVRKAGFDMSITGIAMLAGGALVANAYLDKLPIADQKIRYAVGAGGAFLASRFAPQLAPALIGFGAVSAGKALGAFFPNIITGIGGNGYKSTTIGRLTASDAAKMRSQIVRQIKPQSAANSVIVGTGAGVIVGNYSHPSFS